MAFENFTQLHNHSHYSLLDGLATIEKMVACAVNQKYKSLALTDHGSCAGLFNFYSECKSNNIKPILGMEAYTTNDHSVKSKESKNHHLILLAKNSVGYKNLMFLSSFGYLKGFYYKPRIDFNILKEHKEGLIVSTACCYGEIPFLLWEGQDEKAKNIASEYKDVFGDDFYIEIMMHRYKNDNEQQAKERKLANKLYKLSKTMGIKAICTTDAHYALKQDAKAHEVLLAIQTGTHIKDPDRMTFGSDDFYLKSMQEMAKLYGKTPDLLTNVEEIVEKIDQNVIVFGEDLLPKFDVPSEFKGDSDYLKALVTDGMKNKNLIGKSEYRKRIKYEMSIIEKVGYTKYFLILWDIINYARTNGIRLGVGRGSAVSSLCLYVLGITKLDPIKYDLIFERFLNPDRISPPDVDVDFDYFRRNEIFDYIVRKYGQDYCSKIGTYNSFKAKAVIRYAAKALDIGNDWEYIQEARKTIPKGKIESKKSLRKSDEIAKLIPEKPGTTIAESMKIADFKQAMKTYPDLLEASLAIEGTLSSAGVHPAGIVVCKDPITNHVPLRISNGIVCSQFEGAEVEKMGLLKFDLLALKTLTVIENTLKMIKERHGISIDIDNLEPNDPAVFKIFSGSNSKIDTRGIFQFEGYGISRLLKEIRVDRFEDLIVANALYRPGPLGAGVHDLYCDYKHGRKKIEYIHPKMGEALSETYGMMIFQENIMRVAQVMAGFTAAQSDTLRYAIGKKKEDVMAEMNKLFIDGCNKNGVEKKIAEKILEQINYFSGYGFNRSHSAAYSFLAYQMAYLKLYYPIEFMCNLLSSEINNNDKGKKLNSYIDQSSKMGIKCYKPHINKSGLKFTIDSHNGVEVIRSPLTMLKGIGEKAVESIVANQPFKDLKEFIEKVNTQAVNIRVFTSLVNYDCMSEAWNMPKQKILIQYEILKKEIDAKKKKKKTQKKNSEKLGAESLFDFMDHDNVKV